MSVVCDIMLRQDPHSKTRGLIKSSSPFNSSPGIIKHPKEIIVPAPLEEEINTNKIINEPDQVGLPVNPEKNIFAESKPTPEQEETFKKEKLTKLDLPTKKSITKKRKKDPDDLFFNF